MLVEFALGIELAQLLVVLVVLIIGFVFHTLLKKSKRDWVLVVSSLIIGLSIPILVENWIF